MLWITRFSRPIALSDSRRSCQSAPEQVKRALECSRVCPSWAHIWAQTQSRENSGAGNCLKIVVDRDGIEPPTLGSNAPSQPFLCLRSLALNIRTRLARKISSRVGRKS